MEETPIEKKEKEPEPTFQILTNPARVMKQQVCTDHYTTHAHLCNPQRVVSWVINVQRE